MGIYLEAINTPFTFCLAGPRSDVAISSQSRCGMNNFRDLSSLESVLRAAEKDSPDGRRAALAMGLEGWGFTKEQASLYASTVFCQNSEGIADRVVTNAERVMGSWVCGNQQGMASAVLTTMKETWKFEYDLTCEHKIERYEGYISPPSPFFQSSYSRPTVSVERGIWAPPDWIGDHLNLFVRYSNGIARPLRLQWIENDNFEYRACSIGGKRFGRE